MAIEPPPVGVEAFVVPPGPDGRRVLSPTDLTQFIMMAQCRRHLRFRLYQHVKGRGFFAHFDASPQEVPILLTQGGTLFEEGVMAQAGQRARLVDLRDGRRQVNPPPDNDRVVALARELAPGETLIVAQPMLTAAIGAWRLRGQADLIVFRRDEAGDLRPLVIDIKRSAASRVEHRLQVAVYDRMLAAIFAEAGEPLAAAELAVLFRGPATPDPNQSEEERRLEEAQREAARERLGVADALLDLVPDPDAFRAELDTLVFAPDSLVEQVAERPFDLVPFSYGPRCDMCLYAEVCLKLAARQDDLSLVPQLGATEKAILLDDGVETVAALAGLKVPREAPGEPPDLKRLVPAAAEIRRVQRLSVAPPLGERLDELIHRARQVRRSQGHALPALSYIPGGGYSSLPACRPDFHPNLVRIFVDVQKDYLTGRVYLLAAHVRAAREGRDEPGRQRTVVALAEAPVDDAAAESALLLDWIRRTIAAALEVVAPDADGAPRAPVHFVFWSRAEQRALLECLDRHADTVLAATPLREFLTQLPGFESPVATLLEEEVRRQKNFYFLCQSLVSVARFTGFDWGPNREIFKTRVFDAALPLERDETGKATAWYTARARFGSAIPLEYAYAAWDDLPPPPERGPDHSAGFRHVTLDDLRVFAEQRVAALAHVAGQFRGNADTEKKPFDLSALTSFSDRARSLAKAIEEFVMIERWVEVSAWRAARLPAPEQRVLAGVSLLAVYEPDDQTPEARAANAAFRDWRRERDAEAADLKAANPDAKLTKSEDPRQHALDGQRFRLRLTPEAAGAVLREALTLTELRADDRVIVAKRWTEDGRLPPAERTPLTPTPKQLMVMGARWTMVEIEVARDPYDQPSEAWAVVEPIGFGGWQPPFAYPGRMEAFEDGAAYTIEEDPNDWYGFAQRQTARELAEGKWPNALLDRLEDPASARVRWPGTARAAQQRFLVGLDAFAHVDGLRLDDEVRRFIGGEGDAPLLQVQGPPGTGKSFTTALALFARAQGALAAGQDARFGVSANTHAAVDVLLEKIADLKERLARWRVTDRAAFDRWFDERLLTLPLVRLDPRGEPAAGVISVRLDEGKQITAARNQIAELPAVVVAAAPSRMRKLVKGHKGMTAGLLDGLVLDEASRMSAPEALMAAMPVKPDAPIVVVGDHRQMQPIRKHDWEHEPRQTFRQYKVYRSVFDWLRHSASPGVRRVHLSESHRLHEQMAAFLRQEIYEQDGIDFRSRRRDLLRPGSCPAPFVASVLDPDYPIVVVIHDEESSRVRNEAEEQLVRPLAAELLARGYDLRDGVGIVVPHRAQRSLLQDVLRELTAADPDLQADAAAAVDTVERFQGGEREAILISATESDPAYLLAAGEFLYDPTRLTVALSRAKRKLILIAARSVFTLFSPDDEVFENALLWKNLIRRTCTDELFAGEVAGVNVRVVGRRAAPGEDEETLEAVSDGLFWATEADDLASEDPLG